MNKRFLLLIGFIGLFLFSCKEDDDIGKGADNNKEISLDSLNTIPSNLPFAKYRDLMFLDENTGYVLSDKFIAKTTDGGHLWTTYPIPIDYPQQYPLKMQFIDNLTGYITAGENNLGILLKTTDGGQNWNTINLNTLDCPEGMFFLNNDIGFITGKDLFAKTMNGGETWTNLKNDTTFKYFLGVNFKNENEGIVTATNGEYFRTSDGGTTWSSFNTVDYLTKNIYFVENQIIVSRNSSASLFDLIKNEGITTAPYNSKFVFFNSKQSIAAGTHYEELGFFPYNDIFITNDGWKTYSQKTLSSTPSSPCIAKMSESKIMIIYSSLSESYVITFKK